MFKKFDKNKNGNLDKKELNQLLRSIKKNLTFNELNFIIDILDTDKNGSIS